MQLRLLLSQTQRCPRPAYELFLVRTAPLRDGARQRRLHISHSLMQIMAAAPKIVTGEMAQPLEITTAVFFVEYNFQQSASAAKWL